ncbi:MAG: hypothetical protein ABWW70_05180 [Thermoproteota archaeon]
MAKDVHIVTHTDLDGIASAAVYLRLLSKSSAHGEADVTFAEPYNLHKVLSTLGQVRRLAIMDLGPNADTVNNILRELSRLRSTAESLEWYDHHKWEDSWLSSARSVGVRVYIEGDTCAAGVVARRAAEVLGVKPDEHIERLVRATCAADLWVWDDPLAPRLYRVVDRYRGPQGDMWRRHLLEKFSQGELWWGELDEALHEYLKLELENASRSLRTVIVDAVRSCRIAVVLKPRGPPSASILGGMLINRFGADVAVVVKTSGNGLSLRSRTVNVRKIAYTLGGGGHPRAAGAPLNMPLLFRIASMFWPKIRARYAARKVKEAITKLGSCPRLEE